MKRILCTISLLLGFFMAQAQTTYYWIGGTSTTAADFRAKTNWSTTLGGSAVSGTGNIAVSATVYLVWDGTNLGTGANIATPIVANVNGGMTAGQITAVNGAKVLFQRGATAGTTTFIVNGDNTAADDFIVGASSAITISGSTAALGYGLTIQLGIAGTATATGAVSGTLNISGGYTNRLYVQNSGAMIFAPGSLCYVSMTGSTYYPFGVSGSVAEKGVVFQNGSSLIYQGGLSVFGNLSTFNAISLVNGSNFIFETPNSANMFGSRYIGNLIVRNNTTVTADGAFYNVDSLAIETGSSLYLNPQGQSPISGSIVNNGVLGINGTATSGVVVMNGANAKTIGGTGSYSLNNITLGSGTDVTLNNNLSITGNLLVEGKLNLQANTISGAGSFETRAAQTDTVTGSVTDGSYTITDVTPASPVIPVGSLVTGAGIQPNTYITYSLSSGTWILSKPVTGTATGITIISNRTAANIVSASAAGLDGNLTITGTKTFNANNGYVFNTATTVPFSSSLQTVTAGNVTVNNNVTLNKNLTLSGVLSLQSGNLTIPAADTIRLLPGATISGTGFGSSKHIVTQVNNITGEKAVLQVDNVSATQLFPVGSASNYLPVTLTPSAPATYYVTAFQGLTTNGAPDGPAYATASNMVNAVWDIKRATSSASCAVTVGWLAALEGSNFSGYSNGQIGIAHYNGTAWDLATGSGDNTANTATSAFTSFSPFAVGQLGTPLALSIINEKAQATGTNVIITWQTADEENTGKYIIESSADGKTYTTAGTVNAKGGTANNYSWTGTDVTTGSMYYRIKGIGADGKYTYSKTLRVTTVRNTGVITSLFPNPASEQLTVAAAINETANAVIIDITGRVLAQVTLRSGNNTVDISKLNVGCYFMIIAGSDKVPFVIAR